MELPVVLEPLADSGFRAQLGAPLNLTAQGATREDALQKLQSMVLEQRTKGIELTTLHVPTGQNGSTFTGGIYREDDPLVQEWLRTIEENRRLDDIAEGIER